SVAMALRRSPHRARFESFGRSETRRLKRPCGLCARDCRASLPGRHGADTSGRNTSDRSFSPLFRSWKTLEAHSLRAFDYPPRRWRMLVDDQLHRDEGFSGREQKLAERREADWGGLDDLTRRRAEHTQERPALTTREREERWPIG